MHYPIAFLITDNRCKIFVYVQMLFRMPIHSRDLILSSSINWKRGKSRHCLYISFSDPGMQSTHFLEKVRDERTDECSNLSTVLRNKWTNTEQWKDTYINHRLAYQYYHIPFFMWSSFLTVGCVGYSKQEPFVDSWGGSLQIICCCLCQNTECSL